ncbi:hypothetical protein [Nonomuraea endophytica]|uniref:hypothetical protein n=1 Tax=Nonomuraea endophytica TaxID=714136 RepID=UPI0037C6EC24
MAAVIVTIYLIAAAAAAVHAAVSGDLRALSMATLWVSRFAVGDWLGLVLAGVCGLNAWALWQVLRGPALPRAGNLPPSVVWLRRLIYAGIAGDLGLWELVEELSDTVEDFASAGLWAATVILLLHVISGIRVWFRAVAIALCLVDLVPLPLGNGPAGVIDLFAAPGFACMVMILIGQRRDGRWSGATIGIGQLSLVVRLGLPVLTFLPRSEEVLFGGVGLLFSALYILSTVWLARTAHELARPAAVPPATGRTSRVSVALALALPLVVVGTEESARFSFTAARETCPSYAATRPEDRQRAFLCLARSEENAVREPMFPKDQPDQRILAHGADLCALPKAKDRAARLQLAGGAAEPHDLAAALEFLCPGVVLRQKADEVLEQTEEHRRDHLREAEWQAEMAKMNARCSDPWPKVRARRQGTAAYRLFEGGGYYIFDDRDETEGPGGDFFKAVDDGFIDAVGSSAAIMTFGENGPMCLTLKAFSKAPPLRLKGWHMVVEVGIASRTGRLVVERYPEGGDSGALGPLPDLAAGPGQYRMRVYAREFEWDEKDPNAPGEEHLIVVYPGRSTKKITHVPRS